MTLQQLKYVVEIANCGSMNEAAKRLFISQPSLSNAIKDLESELGIVIFARTNRGISISAEGLEFLGYARQIVEQTELIERHYRGAKPKAVHFSVATQHYAFVVKAFIKLMNQFDAAHFELSLRETKTYEIIEHVRTLRSDIGILYINELNAKVMNKLFSDNNLKFTPLFNANPHIFIRNNHPLAGKESVTLADLTPYPFITFEQGDNHSLHFSEEIISPPEIAKSIKVNDRATLLNLLIGTDSYTIGTGIIVSALNGSVVKSVPIENSDIFTVGWIAHKDIKLNKIASAYIDILNDEVSSNYFDLTYCLL